MLTEFIIEKIDGGMHFILLEKKLANTLTKNNNKRVICTINKAIEFHAAIIPKKDGSNIVQIGLPTLKKLKLKQGVKVTATFTVDETAYQFDMPEELKEVLDTDDEANKVFHALTPGNQRGLIYLLSLVKSTDKKIERALKIAERIKIGITSPRLILK
jgi:Bacteriocin-protection, YdeI or OmpD-Associated/Domain of unknown function (DUF1905)